METIHQPHTEEKALALTRLMSEPLPKREAITKLHGLLIDERLACYLGKLEEDEDARLLIRFHLLGLLSDASRLIAPWEDIALKLCWRLIDRPS
ncbi:hypothetical protein [Hahella sp. HN01]|uniref:hypothetical protein n=1 Tax=Hahella sp. HN01 TaxID=2847262 RepID=UPI001C1EF79A|nr:hypothetical protein [Hahella sp. HN01]MBU6956040.1 hypothetical protein [Hahella sp. HN01]